jgi:ubiquinol-cytochrome c reductase iron-sulfur subunit
VDRIARVTGRGSHERGRGAEAGHHERRDVRVISAAFAISVVAAVGLGVLYWQGGQPQLEGTLLALAAGGIAAGLIMWSHRLLPNEAEVEDREELASSRKDRAAFDADLDRGQVFSRRRVLRRFLVAALTAIGAAFVLPLRSLGPRPSDRELDSSPWKAGTRLVTEDGSVVRAADVPSDGLVTVFPDGAVDSESGQAVLMRVEPNLLRPLPGRDSWTPGGLVAYSKVCTHAGCPVGLYEATSHQLLCPCHQSTFDVLNGAKPVFGPAAARLPQLPLAVDASGHVYATGGFSEPPGPAFWDRKS